MRWVGVAAVVLVCASGVSAGEILFTNGSRLTGELVNEVLMVSTGSDLVEVLPEQIGELTPNAIHLKDGRVIRGQVVGGHVKARTLVGEIAIKADELQRFRADGYPVATASRAEAVAPRDRNVSADPGPVPGPAGPEPRATPEARPTVPAPEPSATAPAADTAPARTVASATPEDSRRPEASRVFEVVAEESPLYEDAVLTAAQVGTVARGERVAYVDFIDRRLRVFNTLILDGGHWIRVRAAGGTVGWVPAQTLREVP